MGGKKKFWVHCFVHLAIFILVVALLDFVLGSLLERYYFKMRSGQLSRTTYSLEKTEANLLIFGSSRAVHHYYPTPFEDSLKMSFYNAGRDGEESVLYHGAILKGVLKRYKPKIVVLDVMRAEFGNVLYSYDRLASLSPYYKTHPEIRSIIDLRSSNEKIRRLSHIYPYNSLIASIFSGNADKKQKKNEDIKGYVQVPGLERITKPIGPGPANIGKPYKTDSVKVHAFKSFIEDCQANNVKLYIVCSPYFELHPSVDLTLDSVRRISTEYKVPFFDFSQQPLFLKSPELFSNTWHLNDTGAKIFSAMVVDSILQAEKPKGFYRSNSVTIRHIY